MSEVDGVGVGDDDDEHQVDEVNAQLDRSAVEASAYLEWRSAAIALKAANLAAVAAAERFKVALAKLAEAAAP